jgi:urease accessory protein
VSVAAPRVGRDGALRLRFERRGARTALVGCGCTLPLQVLAPVALDDPSAVVSVLNPTGGLVGGDRLEMDIDVGPGAHACLTTPSATKVYRARDEAALQRVRVSVGAGATLEWVPDHTIPAAGAAFRQAIDVDLGPAARLILVDAFAAGRVARGEAWRFRHLESALAIHDHTGWLLHDRFVLSAGEAWSGLGFTEGAPYFATVVVIMDGEIDGFRAAAGAALASAGIVGGVAALPRQGAIVRCLAGDAPTLADGLDALWIAARATVLGLPPLALRK